jgi:hypothetical protein
MGDSLLTGLFQIKHTENMEETEVKAQTFVSQTSGRTTKIDWVKAKEYYLSDPKMSYQKVAKEFNTTYKSVQRWAAKENWINQRKNNATEESLGLANRPAQDTPEETNQRQIDGWLQMQKFITTNVAIAQGYVREKYLEAERDHKAVDKKLMFSGQNVKYLMEALKVAYDGERVAKNMNITGPTKSEKDIKVSATMARYEPAQIEAMFAGARDIVQEMKKQTQREFVDGEIVDGQ